MLWMTTIEALAVRVEDAAKLAGLGRTEIYKAIKDGGLASLKAGKRRLIWVDALRRWLAGLERTAA
jgi:excisionase family DNA binding protein